MSVHMAISLLTFRVVSNERGNKVNNRDCQHYPAKLGVAIHEVYNRIVELYDCKDIGEIEFSAHGVPYCPCGGDVQS